MACPALPCLCSGGGASLVGSAALLPGPNLDRRRPLPLPCLPQEAMRLVPVSGGTVRVSPDRPLRLGGHTIPAGVEILLAVHGELEVQLGCLLLPCWLAESEWENGLALPAHPPLEGPPLSPALPPAALMNCERYWDRPSEFLPERWEEDQAEYWLGDAPGKGPAKQQAGVAAAAGAAADGFQLVDDEEALRVSGKEEARRSPLAAGRLRQEQAAGGPCMFGMAFGPLPCQNHEQPVGRYRCWCCCR